MRLPGRAAAGRRGKVRPSVRGHRERPTEGTGERVRFLWIVRRRVRHARRSTAPIHATRACVCAVRA